MVIIANFKAAFTKLLVFCGITALMTVGMNGKIIAAVVYNLTDLGSSDLTSDNAIITNDINDLGQIVGVTGNLSVGNDSAFVWSKTTGITKLGTLPGGSYSQALGINNIGQVVGLSDYENSNGRPQGFLWSQNTGIIHIGIDGDNGSRVNAINDAGQAVGFFAGSDSGTFLWSSSAGSINPRTIFGNGVSFVPDLINNLGQLVGSTGNGDGVRVFLWSQDSGIIDLATIPVNSNFIEGINDAGQLVGNSDSGYGAFLLSSTGITDIAETKNIKAEDINNLGQVVGRLTTLNDEATTDDTAVVWSKSNGLLDLNTQIDPSLGWRLTDATAINNKGQIIGYAFNNNGERRSFLLTPVPEPLTTGGTALAGVGLLYLRLRQRQLLKG
jgi:probable HAF family extracellular repeat protein